MVALSWLKRVVIIGLALMMATLTKDPTAYNPMARTTALAHNYTQKTHTNRQRAAIQTSCLVTTEYIPVAQNAQHAATWENVRENNSYALPMQSGTPLRARVPRTQGNHTSDANDRRRKNKHKKPQAP